MKKINVWYRSTGEDSNKENGLFYVNEFTSDVDISKITCGKEIHKITLKLFKFIEHENRMTGEIEYKLSSFYHDDCQLFNILVNPSTEARTLINILNRKIVFSERNIVSNTEVSECALIHPNANKKIVTRCFGYLLPTSIGSSRLVNNSWVKPWDIFKNIHNIK